MREIAPACGWPVGIDSTRGYAQPGTTIAVGIEHIVKNRRRCGAQAGNAIQVGAAGKGILADARHTGADRHTGQGITVGEGEPANGGHLVGDRQRHQAAVGECRIANVGHRRGYRYSR